MMRKVYVAFSRLPMPALAPEIDDVKVIGFDPLMPETAEQAVAARTPLTELDLPERLVALGFVIDGAADDSGAANAVPMTVEGIRWRASDPMNGRTAEYDGMAETGIYLFRPTMPDGYFLTPGVRLPEIGVQIGIAQPAPAVIAAVGLA